ncbi:MAG: RNA polymerase sigma factor [Dyadobacter sp.]
MKKFAYHSEAELVFLLKCNNRQAFEYIYDHYAPGLFGIICKIVRDANKADDVVQDSFLKIWKNIQTYSPEKGTLFTWMLNVARNTAIDQLRADLKFEAHIKLDIMSESQLTSTSVFQPTQITMDLRNFVEGLLPERKQLIELVYFQGYTHEEASEHLRLPLGTVKSRVRTALKDLRQVFYVPSSVSGSLNCRRTTRLGIFRTGQVLGTTIRKLQTTKSAISKLPLILKWKY